MSNETETTPPTPFPIDWNAWLGEWRTWKAAHPEVVAKFPTPTQFRGPKNFLADDVLGVFATPAGRLVELSEVTFDIRGRNRYVGLTWDHAQGGSETALAASWAELDRLLGLTEAPIVEHVPATPPTANGRVLELHEPKARAHAEAVRSGAVRCLTCRPEKV